LAPPSARSGDAHRSTGGGSGPIRILSAQTHVPTWGERIQEARRKLPLGDSKALLDILHGKDTAAAFAVLSLENEGKVRFKTELLAKLLNTTNTRMIAKAAALLLSRREDANIDTLIRHIEKLGPADDLAVELLMRSRSRKGLPVLLQRASNATRKDAAGLLAIRALALYDGKNVTLTLNRLAQDWSEEISATAKKALAQRKKLGLEVKTAYKAPPTRTYTFTEKDVPTEIETTYQQEWEPDQDPDDGEYED
jgi:hypothetical protein